MKNAVGYTRTSTKEQAERYSLSAQEKIIEQYAERKGYNLIRVFVEKGESAKTTARTELNRLIQFVSRNHDRIDAVIVSQVDRLSRELIDYLKLGALFNKIGIKIESATENIDDTPSGKFIENILVASAKFDNDMRAERTKSGMKEAIGKGKWCWPAPIGYRFSKDHSNRSKLVPTEESRFIKEIFEMAATGLYKQTEIVEKLRRKGFKRLSKQLLNRILRNSLYCGLILKREWHKDYIKASHEPIISEDTFFKVQGILNGRRPDITPRLRNNPDFPLRGSVRCWKCKGKLTGSWSRGRSKRYPYYHCPTKGCSLYVRKGVLDKKFTELVESLQLRDEMSRLFGAVVRDIWKTRQKERIKEKQRIEKELRELEADQKRIEDLVMKGVFDEETYERRAKKIKDEITSKRLELNDLAENESHDMGKCLAYCQFFLSNCASLWERGALDFRQRFQKLVFPEEIYYDGKAL